MDSLLTFLAIIGLTSLIVGAIIFLLFFVVNRLFWPSGNQEYIHDLTESHNRNTRA